jgi:hypothetical protein
VGEVSGELHRGGSVVLDAAGSGSVFLVPDNAWQRWVVEEIAVTTSQAASATPVPAVQIFVGSTASQLNAKGASWSGNQETFRGTVRVGPCDTLAVVFTAGIPGVTASAVVEGTYYKRVS